jgi:peptidoglycan/LPS O-acetylase OafA/YrhL
MLQPKYHGTNFITSLRAIAILFVFIIHSGGGGLRELGDAGNFIVEVGKYGVQIFFVISGFTIFHQFFSENYTFKRFILVRIARLSIPYYPILLIIFAYINFGGTQFNNWAQNLNDGQISLANLITHISYTSSYFLKYQNSIIGVEWTLGIEAFYYLLFGFLIHFKLMRLARKPLLWWCSLFIIEVYILKLLKGYYDLDSLYVHWLPFKYAYMFFLGGVAYHLRMQRNMQNKTSGISKGLISDLCLLTILITFVGFIVASIYFHLHKPLVEAGFVVGTFAIIIFFDDAGKLSFSLNNRALIFIGSISYSFYLIHFPIINMLPKLNITILDFLVSLISTIVISYCWYTIFEKIIYLKIKRMINLTNAITP